MKTSLLAGVSLGALALVTGAQAADLPVRPVYKAPVAAPMWNWSGFYVGGTLGGVWSQSTVSDDPASPFTGRLHIDGLPSGLANNGVGMIGGAEVGFNWQVANWVLGIEADFSGSSLSHSVTPVPGALESFQTRLDWLSTVRGRVGYAFDRWLVYGTGGAAFAHLQDSYTSPLQPINAVARSTVAGWTVGGGVEYALSDHWTVKAEYLHVGFDNRTATDTGGGGYIFDFKDRADIGRVGINYKF